MFPIIDDIAAIIAWSYAIAIRRRLLSTVPSSIRVGQNMDISASVSFSTNFAACVTAPGGPHAVNYFNTIIKPCWVFEVKGCSSPDKFNAAGRFPFIVIDNNATWRGSYKYVSIPLKCDDEVFADSLSGGLYSAINPPVPLTSILPLKPKFNF